MAKINGRVPYERYSLINGWEIRRTKIITTNIHFFSTLLSCDNTSLANIIDTKISIVSGQNQNFHLIN